MSTFFLMAKYNTRKLLESWKTCHFSQTHVDQINKINQCEKDGGVHGSIQRVLKIKRYF